LALANSDGRAASVATQPVEERLAELGLVLPAPLQLPTGVVLPFAWVRVVGRRALISGHGPTNADGSLAKPLGKVGRDMTQEQGYAAARLVALAILGSLKRELGDLDRIASWTHAFGMVNSAPGFNLQPAVINGFTDLIIEVFGPERGTHARSAVGMAELPFDIPVEVEAEVELVP
jgi:enamine deaminase RidA (YjgF/YER057c/UK114 family)